MTMTAPVAPLLVACEGTWGGSWTNDTGPDSFRQWVASQGFRFKPFRGWSTDVDRIPNWLDRDGNYDWIAGAYALRECLVQIPYEDRNILCHSHGIGPVLYQCALTDPEYPAVPVRRILSICSPPRKDLEAVAALALTAGTIEAWRHVFADGWDFWARVGQAFDGHWGWRRHWEVAGMNNFPEKGIGHSEIFTPELRHRLIPHLAFLRGD